MSTNLCGDIVPCGAYFTSNLFNTSFNITYDKIFQINNGSNLINLNQPLAVSKGSFILLQQITGRIAIYQSSNDYSDLVFQTNAWISLVPKSNWRFYFSTLNNFTSYQGKFNIQHTYMNIGTYTITLKFLSSNQTYQQIINVTDSNIILF